MLLTLPGTYFSIVQYMYMYIFVLFALISSDLLLLNSFHVQNDNAV